MIKVGITGGIGSGKSIICDVLKTLGYPVYNSDNQAKWLMNNHPELKLQLIGLFGSELYLNDQLNKPFLAELIFKDSEIRKKVNELVHPIVRQDFKNWCLDQHTNLVFQESALLLETGNAQSFDSIILVVAPESTRIERVAMRDSKLLSEINNRIQSQLTDTEKQNKANFTIYNGKKDRVFPQIMNVIGELKRQFEIN